MKIKEDQKKIILEQNEKFMLIQRKSEDHILQYRMELKTPTNEENLIMRMPTLSKKSFNMVNQINGDRFKDEKFKPMIRIIERMEKFSPKRDSPKTDKDDDIDRLRIKQTERIKEIKKKQIIKLKEIEKVKEKVKEKELERLRDYHKINRSNKFSKDYKDNDDIKINISPMKNSQINLLPIQPNLVSPLKPIQPKLSSMTILRLNGTGTMRSMRNITSLANISNDMSSQNIQKSPIHIKSPSFILSSNDNKKDKNKGRKLKQVSTIERKSEQNHNSSQIEEFKFQIDDSIYGEVDGFSLGEYLKYQSLNGDLNDLS